MEGTELHRHSGMESGSTSALGVRSACKFTTRTGICSITMLYVLAGHPILKELRKKMYVTKLRKGRSGSS